MAEDNTLLKIMTNLKKAGNYILNSDYTIVWQGSHASPLNTWNEYIESITIPGKTITTNESRIANSVVAKIAGDISYEDMEITWRLSSDMKLYSAISDWMSAAKNVNAELGLVTTGYWDDYCKANQVSVGVGQKGNKFLVTGLYPTSLQSIQFSAEGGETVKVTATFSCYIIEHKASK